MYIKVYVTPGARKESLVERGDALYLAVREEASGNRANDRVRELIALRCGVPVGAVRILTGHHSRGKMVSVTS